MANELNIGNSANWADKAKVNVLLVDDSRDNLLVLRAILDDLDQNLVEASTGEDALQLMQQDDFAVVLLDVQMPGLSGVETAQRIRALPRSRYTPILFITAYDASEFSMDEAYALGAVDYLVKPLNPVVLRGKVSGLVEIFRDKQKALREAEQLRMLVHGTTEYAIFLLDATGHIISWNPGAQRIKGWEAHEILGQHFSRFYTDDARERGWPQYELKVASEVGRFEDEGWRLRKDGSRFWANVVITALYDQSGKLKGFSKITRDMTERKQAEENARKLAQEQAARRAAEEHARIIQEQRERLHVTLNSIGDAVISTDVEGHVTFMNPIAERLTGFTQQEAAGKHLTDVFRIVNEKTRNTVENPAIRALRDGVTVGLANHTLLIAKDGTELPIDDSAAPIRDDAGQAFGAVLVFRDVSERRRTDEAIHRSEEQARRRAVELDAVIEGIPDAVYFGTAEGITKCNTNALKMLGVSSIEELQHDVGTLTSKFAIRRLDTGEPIRPEEFQFSRALSGETIIDYIRARRVDSGREVYIRSATAPIYLDGRIIGAVAINSDVTEQKRAESMSRFLADVTAVLVGSLHYQSILREVAELSVPMLGDFCLFDVTTTDDQLERVGWKHIDPQMDRLSERLRTFAPQRSATQHPITQVLHTGQPLLIDNMTDERLQEMALNESHLQTLRELNIRSLMTVPMVVAGRRHGTLTFGRSNSHSPHSVDELRLAEEIGRRTALTLDNSKLFLQLRDADRKKDEFLAVLAHELRNPLAPLSNALQVLRLSSLNEQTAQVREMMERQVKQMVRLVDDLLDVSRITSGKIELRPETLNLSEVILSALETSRPLIETARHELTVRPPDEMLLVNADKTRLAQAISNLLTNAAKYTPEGGHIWLNVERAGNEAVVRVRDNGIGIPEDMLPRIFEMFTQVDRNIGRSQGGLGIGLTLVKRLVEMHGGTVQARSEGPGRGSEFIVQLPLASEKPKNSAEQPPSVSDQQSRRILVVDDNIDSANSLAMLLRMRGHDVLAAHDGFSALEIANSFAPEVVLLDIGMPGIDGLEVARQLRRMPNTKGAVLIAQTGWGQSEDHRRSVEAGFDYHFTKPVDVEMLQQLMADV